MLDISILNQNAKFLCAIENKVWAPESGNQLEFYRKALDAHWRNYTIHRVFLTPKGEEPEKAEERKHWTVMSYKDILRLVERTIETQGDSVNEDVAALLRQYAVTLRRNIVPEVSNDAHKLARKIYLKHKQAMDLIIENRDRYEPNYPNEGFWMVKEAVGRHPEWKESTCNSPYARFVSDEWGKYEVLKVSGWPAFMLQFQVHVTYDRAVLSLCLHWKGDETLRRKLFDGLRAIPEVFQGEFPNYTSNDTIDLKISEILKESDYEYWWDEERTRETISRRLDQFAQLKFPKINDIVKDCLENYTA